MNEKNQTEHQNDFKRLEKQVVDRDKPFFQIFGDELSKHKESTVKWIGRLSKDLSREATHAESKL